MHLGFCLSPAQSIRAEAAMEADILQLGLMRSPLCLENHLSRLGLKVETVQGKQYPWNGLRHLGDSGNGGTTLEFLSPILWRAPPLEMQRERREFFPVHSEKGSLLSS